MTESPRKNILLMKRSLLMGFPLALPCKSSWAFACMCACAAKVVVVQMVVYVEGQDDAVESLQCVSVCARARARRG